MSLVFCSNFAREDERRGKRERESSSHPHLNERSCDHNNCYDGQIPHDWFLPILTELTVIIQLIKNNIANVETIKIE